MIAARMNQTQMRWSNVAFVKIGKLFGSYKLSSLLILNYTVNIKRCLCLILINRNLNKNPSLSDLI